MTAAHLTPYQQYIHISRYARWDETKKRRETWDETVDRYITFFKDRFDSYPYEEIRDAIYYQEVMPSMRCLMTAGTALSRDQIAGYNCSYVAIDHPRAFDEILYILMCFAPDTEIQTRNGVKQIQHLTINDEIKCLDEESGIFYYTKPLAVGPTPSMMKPKIELEMEDGSIVRCTADHKFLTKNRGWVEAQHLTEEDDIVDGSNSTTIV